MECVGSYNKSLLLAPLTTNIRVLTDNHLTKHTVNLVFLSIIFFALSLQVESFIKYMRSYNSSLTFVTFWQGEDPPFVGRLRLITC